MSVRYANSGMFGRYITAIYWLVFFIFGVWLFHREISERVAKLSIDSTGTLVMPDLAHYVFIAKQFWFSGVADIYSFETFRNALEQETVKRFVSVMPLALLPTVLITMFSLAVISRIS